MVKDAKHDPWYSQDFEDEDPEGCMLFLPSCHPGHGGIAVYIPESKVLSVECTVCREEVIAVYVARQNVRGVK